MLFLHGFPEFWYEWHRQLVEFGRDFYAVAPDLRGYNLSDKPEGVDQYRASKLVADIRELARVFTKDPFVLVAHDWGGAAAWAYALAHPDTLRKLVILNAPHPATFQRELQHNPAQQRASQYFLLFRAPEAETVVAANHYAFLAAALQLDRRSAEEGKWYREAWSQPGALTGMLNYYRATRLRPPALDGEPVALPDVDAAQVTVRVPTLVIWGERDSALVKENLNGLEQFVTDLRVERVPDASHWIVYEKPERVSELISAFVR